MRISSSVVKILTSLNKSYFVKFLKKRRKFEFDKKNLYSWMNLTKKERFNLSKRDSLNYHIKRKNLLSEIRNEYKNFIEKN